MLLIRNEIYYFRWQVPEVLRLFVGKTEIVKSLRTKVRSEALARIAPFVAKVEHSKLVKDRYLMSEVSKEKIEKVIREIWEDAQTRSTAREGDREAILDDASNTEREAKVWSIAHTMSNELDLTDMFQLDMHKKKMAMIMLEKLGYNYDTDDMVDFLPAMNAISPQLTLAIAHYADRVKKAHDLNVPIEVPERFKQVLANPLNVEEKTFSPPLSEVIAGFIEFKTRKGLSKKSLVDYKNHADTLLHILEDKPVADLSRKDLRTCFEIYQNLPKRNKKPYCDMGLEEMLGMDIPEDDLIQPKTAGAAYKMLQGVWVYARDELEIEGLTPVADLKLNLTKSKSYGKYSDAEVGKILSHPIKHRKLNKWIMLIGAYSGARLGEIVQLRKQDVKIDDESGRHYFFISPDAGNLKTENAIRQIPIHQVLIHTGLLKFVEECKTERLFDGLTTKRITQDFSQHREDSGVPQIDDHGKRRVFHSFRHTVITKARNAGVSDYLVQQVVGHEKTSAGVTDRYSHDGDLKNLLCVIDCIDY